MIRKLKGIKGLFDLRFVFTCLHCPLNENTEFPINNFVNVASNEKKVSFSY